MGHINHLYDFTIGGFIEYEERLLLLFHKRLGTWMNVGGHVEPNENPKAALWREIFEETGLKQENLSLIEPHQERPDISDTSAEMLPIPFDFTVYFSGKSKTHQHIDLAYMMKSNTNKVIHNPEESLSHKWVTVDELESMQNQMFPNVYKQCMFALKKLSTTTVA